MIYFLLPRLSVNTPLYIDYISTNLPPICISNSLSHFLSDIKEHITSQPVEWDNYKKYTNTYEYIHTMIHQKKKSIAKYKPLSRSFFKMIELATCFNICNVLCDKSTDSILRPIQTFHLAEGPGGFIEAIAYLRKCSEDKYIGMTLLSDDDYNIPSWKKSAQFLKENPNVQIESGIDKTGNILSLDNFKYCSQKYKSSMDIITGDGGFDFSVDFNHQESNISKLLFAQIAYALAMQKYKGSFILKIFDSFMQHTIDLIAILSSFYDQIYITKPQTSRSANSEKYIVCLNFIHESNDSFLPQLYTAFEKMANSPNGPDRYLNHNIPSFFITKLEEYNSIFGQMQIDNIHSTLALIDNRFKSDKIESLLKINIQKCIQWCVKYDIQYNNIPTNVNVFTADATNDARRQSCFSR